MEMDEVVAHLIMEAVSEPMRPSNVKVFDKNNLFYLSFDTTLQDFDIENRNKRIYVGSKMAESLAAPHITELMQKKSWMGEFGHPITDDIKRILTIDPKFTCHRIVKFNKLGNVLKGTIETLDDGKYGSQFTKNILQGVEPAFSLRALAQLTKKPNGTTLVENKAHIVTYDAVILPSHKSAYRDESVPIKKIIKQLEIDGNTMMETTLLPVQESQIIDYLKEESSNVKLVSNICEVALDNATFSNDLKHVIVKEGAKTFYIDIDEKIKYDINNYLKNI